MTEITINWLRLSVKAEALVAEPTRMLGTGRGWCLLPERQSPTPSICLPRPWHRWHTLHPWHRSQTPGDKTKTPVNHNDLQSLPVSSRGSEASVIRYSPWSRRLLQTCSRFPCRPHSQGHASPPWYRRCQTSVSCIVQRCWPTVMTDGEEGGRIIKVNTNMTKYHWDKVFRHCTQQTFPALTQFSKLKLVSSHFTCERLILAQANIQHFHAAWQFFSLTADKNLKLSYFAAMPLCPQSLPFSALFQPTAPSDWLLAKLQVMLVPVSSQFKLAPGQWKRNYVVTQEFTNCN